MQRGGLALYRKVVFCVEPPVWLGGGGYWSPMYGSHRIESTIWGTALHGMTFSKVLIKHNSENKDQIEVLTLQNKPFSIHKKPNKGVTDMSILYCWLFTKKSNVFRHTTALWI